MSVFSSSSSLISPGSGHAYIWCEYLLLAYSWTNNNHPLVTRSKVGVYKPKLMLSLSIGPLKDLTSFK